MAQVWDDCNKPASELQLMEDTKQVSLGLSGNVERRWTAQPFRHTRAKARR